MNIPRAVEPLLAVAASRWLDLSLGLFADEQLRV